MTPQELSFEPLTYTEREWVGLSEAQKKYAIDANAADAGLDLSDRSYVKENLEFFDRFIVEAHKVVASGYQHYSGYTIKEYLRHHTSIETKGNTFKINDHIVPKVTRLSMQMFPMLNNLFETRK